MIIPNLPQPITAMQMSRPQSKGGRVVDTSNNPLQEELQRQTQGGILDPAGFFDKYNEEARKATEEQRVWSAQQAQKQMDYQTEMANTQYQRAVKDMQAAGLNPYLLMTGASTAPTPSGAMAVSNTQDVYNKNDVLTRDKALMDFFLRWTNTVVGAMTKMI